MMKLTAGVLLALHIVSVLGGNILVFLPMPYKSHTMSYMPIFSNLAVRGHNVTLVSPYQPKQKHPNLHHILVNDIYETMSETFDGDVRIFNTWFTKVIDFWMFGPPSLELILKEEPVQRIIQDTTSTFDVVIIETFFVQEPFTALGYKYNAPIINMNNFELTSGAAAFTGNPYPLSYIPDFKIDSTDRMGSLERFLNTVTYIFEYLGTELYYIPKMEALMRTMEFPGSENLPPLKTLLRNTSLTLTDSHFSIGYPRPQHHNIIEFGGLTVQDAPKLPQYFQDFMDNAKQGVIYINFGTFFNMSTLRKEEIDGLFGALVKVKQQVILKWEMPTLPVNSKNILFADWLPQTSILAHPNCKLFITHGGIHGIYEASAHGVPLLGYPLFGDQSHNLVFVESKGFGRVLKEFKMDLILNEISTILSDTKYKQNAEKMSKIIMDRPLDPLENAIFWVEYVMRHKGAHHLRPAVIDIPFYQYFLLDVIAFMLSITFLMVCVTLKTFKIIFSLFKTGVQSSSSKSGKSKRHKNE